MKKSTVYELKGLIGLGVIVAGFFASFFEGGENLFAISFGVAIVVISVIRIEHGDKIWDKKWNKEHPDD